ncbi:metallophosphoesterase [Aminobacterium mobile]
MIKIKRSEGGFIGAYITLYVVLFLFFYHYFRFKGIPPLSWNTLFCIWSSGALLMMAPIIPPRWRFSSLRYIHTALAWVGTIGLAFGLYFVLASLVIDTTAYIFSLSWEPPLPRWDLWLAFCTAFFICLYGYKESMAVRVVSIQIPTEKLPKEFSRFRILQISDLHLGILINKKMLRQIMKQIQEENPDVIVSTGDLLDGEIEDVETISQMMLHYHPPYGKFAVTGNHEFYAGIEHALYFTGKAGFHVLRGKIVEAGPIYIVGVDDPGGRFLKGQPEVEEDQLLKNISDRRFTLLLKHRPLPHRGAVGMFDLQLSGHVHRGQLFPFMAFTWLFYRHTKGLLDLGKGSLLYVSHGTGTWGPPVRVLAYPELTVIDLVSRSSKEGK